MTRMIPGRAAAAAALALSLLAGCDRMGNPLELVAGRTSAPDEFQVIARKPLRMPMSAALPEPRPGAPSPLDPTPQRDAAVALLGPDFRPVATVPSGGEQALLAAANAAAADPTIRQTLAADDRSASEEYRLPTIWELFGFGGEAAPEDAIDPAAEARRLQSQGIPAPVDPNYRPAEPETVVVQDPNLYPQMGVDRRPQNKLPSSAPVPAF